MTSARSIARLTPMTMTMASAILDGPRDDGWAADYPTEGDVEVATWLVTAREGFPEAGSRWGPMVVIDARTGLIVGGVGFHAEPRADGTVEIGYAVAASVHGHGIATEAVRLLIATAAEQGAHAAVAGTDSTNLPSQRVLEKNGFTMSGRDGDELRWLLRLAPSAS